MSVPNLIPSTETTESAIMAGAQVYRAESENIANQFTSGYLENIPSFSAALKQSSNFRQGDNLGISNEMVAKIEAKIEKRTDGVREFFDPGNPNADERGMVKGSNVNMARAMSNSNMANHYISANMGVYEQAMAMAEGAIRNL